MSVILQKNSCIIDEKRTNYFLGIASGKKDEIIRNIEKIERKLNKTKVIAVLAHGMDSKIITANDVRKIVDQYENDPVIALTLLEKYQLFEGVDASRLLELDLNSLKKLSVKFGPNNNIDHLDFVNNSGIIKRIRTCEEYECAINEGFYAQNNSDSKIASYLEQYNSLLNALINAKTPLVSFLKTVGIHDLRLIPGSFFPFGPDVDKNIQNMSYQELVNNGTLIIRESTKYSIHIEEPNGMVQYLEEALRSDLNNDGVEDLLVFEYGYAIQGTLGYGRTHVLTRNNDDEQFKILEGP